MSLLDQVRKLEQQVVDRLKELEPLTREYDQLRKLAERLGITYSSRSADSDAKTSAPASRGGSAAGARRRTGRSTTKSATARAAKTPAKPRATRPSTRKPAASSTEGRRGAASAKATPASARKRAGAGRARSGGRRATAARPGQRNDEVLRLVIEHPGITVREIAERLGVDPTGLYRVAKRLTDDGRARKDGTRLFPTDSATAAPASAEAPATTAAQTTPESAPQPPQAPAPAEPESPTTDGDTASSDDQ